MNADNNAFSSAPWPVSVSELERSEQFISKVFRLWILGLHLGNPAHWATAWNEFALIFGTKDGKEALGFFSNLIKAFQGHARKSILYHQPGCPSLGTDEIRVICLVAACQHHNYSLARRLAEWMVHQEGVGEMLKAASCLANSMADRGLLLPIRIGDPAPHNDQHLTTHPHMTMH